MKIKIREKKELEETLRKQVIKLEVQKAAQNQEVIRQAENSLLEQDEIKARKENERNERKQQVEKKYKDKADQLQREQEQLDLDR